MARIGGSKYRKLFLGLGATVSGVVTYYYINRPNKRVYASWTTSYEPSLTAKWDDNWDHRSPRAIVNPKLTKGQDNEISQELESHKPKAIRHIILIRHGQYHTEGRTDEERVLTKLGMVQADHTGKRLKELNLPYTDMVKSTMSRAQQTGAIIEASLPNVPVSNCELLREGAPIPPEPPLGSWKQESYQFFTDGARIEAAFRKYFHRADVKQEQDSYTVLVCHANVIRYFVCRALQFPPEAWLRMSLNHASLTWISITPGGRCILKCLGESGHMPPEHISSR